MHLVKGNIFDIKKLLRNLSTDIDVVFHEAAIASVEISVNNPTRVFETNVRSTMKVIDFCLNSKVKKFIFASSSGVDGDSKGQVLKEDMRCKPISPYSASKIAVENYLDAYYQTFGFDFTSLRYFNVYGPRQSNNEYSGVITIFMDKILKNRSPVIFGNGLQSRDFVNVKDIVRANMLAMRSKNAVGEIMNIGTGKSLSILNLIDIIKRILGKKKIKPKFMKERTGDIRHSLSSIEKARKLIGYNPTIDIKNGLDDYIQHLVSQN